MTLELTVFGLLFTFSSAAAGLCGYSLGRMLGARHELATLLRLREEMERRGIGKSP